jgi:hypothetical protein
MKDIRFLGWCYEKNAQGKVTHDKIWGIIRVDGSFITFWGRRDKKLQFKRASSYDDDVFDLMYKKQRKGYHASSWEEMVKLDPEFETRFEEEIILVQLGNFFHVKA